MSIATLVRNVLTSNSDAELAGTSMHVLTGMSFNHMPSTVLTAQGRLSAQQDQSLQMDRKRVPARPDLCSLAL
jgi:hypothetical protein